MMPPAKKKGWWGQEGPKYKAHDLEIRFLKEAGKALRALEEQLRLDPEEVAVLEQYQAVQQLMARIRTPQEGNNLEILQYHLNEASRLAETLSNSRPQAAATTQEKPPTLPRFTCGTFPLQTLLKIPGIFQWSQTDLSSAFLKELKQAAREDPNSALVIHL